MFEARLNQDGEINFSYYPVMSNRSTNKSNLVSEGATIGIFVNDNGWNFRDLSSVIGHPSDNDRIMSEFGGFSYDESYSDPSVFNGELIYTPYNSSLVCLSADDISSSDISGEEVPPSLTGRMSNWPSRNGRKNSFQFSPPKRVRKTLPKREIISEYTENRLPKSRSALRSTIENINYNDNYTVNFSEIVNDLQRPTRTKRFYGEGFEGANERQDLFTGIKIPGTQSSKLYNFNLNKPNNSVVPFVDSDVIKESFRSKTFFDLDFPVHHTLKMEGRKSAIYYYNKSAKGFFKPNPGDSISSEQFVEGNIVNHILPNDYRGFGPTGKNVSTSINDLSNNPELDIRNTIQNSENKPWSVENRDKFLTKKYPETVQNNSDYLSNLS